MVALDVKHRNNHAVSRGEMAHQRDDSIVFCSSLSL